MATKTISIDLVAYERLNNARLGPKDSFSQVIRRAQWQQEAKTCGGLLAALEGLPTADEAVIQHLESAQQEDLCPDNPWS
jgi:predicted CopG family antitoxin